MAFAHICHRCGSDLSRIRGVIHRDFGLPVVHCPGCDSTIVRRLVGHRTPGKGAKRILSAGGVLLRNTVLLTIITIAHLAGSYQLAETDLLDVLESLSVQRLGVIFPVLVFPVLVGIVLFSCFRHVRPTVLISAWWIYGALWLAAIAAPDIIDGFLYDNAAGRMRRLERQLDTFGEDVGASVIMLGIEMFGAIPGILLARATRHGRRVRRTKRRRRFRIHRGRMT